MQDRCFKTMIEKKKQGAHNSSFTTQTRHRDKTECVVDLRLYFNRPYHRDRQRHGPSSLAIDYCYDDDVDV